MKEDRKSAKALTKRKKNFFLFFEKRLRFFLTYSYFSCLFISFFKRSVF